MPTPPKFDPGAIQDSLADDWEESLAQAEGALKDWRDKTVAALREKADALREGRAKPKRAGRKPFPKKRRRSIRLSLSFNEEEFDAVEKYVGDRETAEVLRNLVLDAIAKAEPRID